MERVKNLRSTGLLQALTALSVTAQSAEGGSGVQDKELVEVLSDLQICPGQPPHHGTNCMTSGIVCLP